MKLLLVLVLCGVACCFAQPRCDPDDEKKCRSIFSFSEKPETEEELDASCRASKCLIDYWSRCKSEDEQLFTRLLEAYHDSLCSRTSSELRKKFLANSRCFGKAEKLIMNDPSFIIDTSKMDHKLVCGIAPALMKRARDFFVNTCNEDTAEVFDKLYPWKILLDC